MVSKVTKRFTYANVAMTLALVFAMSGGAYAAKHYLITSTKQISPSVLKTLKGAGPRGLQGPQGSPGATGPAGPIGPSGPQGSEGKAGSAGQNGTSVTSVQLKASDAACKKEGGSEFTAAEGQKTIACNGSPWTAGGILPKGSSETGQWVALGEGKKASEPVAASISFAVPLTAGLSEAHVHLIKVGEEGKEFAEECPGTVAEPKAKSGSLCVYTKNLFDIVPGVEKAAGSADPFLDQSTGGSGAGTSGTSIRFETVSAEIYFGGGTWAVTG
jgi:hypothetical protein